MTTPYATLASILRFMHKHERWTRAEFVTGTGMSRAAAERLIIVLRRTKTIHIDEWMDDSMGRQSIAVFVFGEGRDARKRTALSGRARTAAYKARKQAVEAVALNAVFKAWHSSQPEGETNDTAGVETHA